MGGGSPSTGSRSPGTGHGWSISPRLVGEWVSSRLDWSTDRMGRSVLAFVSSRSRSGPGGGGMVERSSVDSIWLNKIMDYNTVNK